MNDKFETDKLYALVPRLLDDEGFRRNALEWASEDQRPFVIRAINGEAIGAAAFDENDLDNVFLNAFQDASRNVLSLGWSPETFGHGGALWIGCVDGVFIVKSSDWDDRGPFESIDEAIDAALLDVSEGPPNPELDSDVLSYEVMLATARKIVDWENQGAIRINGTRYAVHDGELVEDDPEFEGDPLVDEEEAVCPYCGDMEGCCEHLLLLVDLH